MTDKRVKLKAKYLLRLASYFHWCNGDFMLAAEMKLDENGPTPEEAMFLWESKGIKPDGCTDPGLLARFVQGKTSRDFHVTEWRRGCSQKLFIPEEFFGCLGLRSAEEFKGIFGREPDVKALQTVKRSLMLAQIER